MFEEVRTVISGTDFPFESLDDWLESQPVTELMETVKFSDDYRDKRTARSLPLDDEAGEEEDEGEEERRRRRRTARSGRFTSEV